MSTKLTTAIICVILYFCINPRKNAFRRNVGHEREASRHQQWGQHANRLELFLARDRNKLSIFALQVFRGAASALESWIEGG